MINGTREHEEAAQLKERLLNVGFERADVRIDPATANADAERYGISIHGLTHLEAKAIVDKICERFGRQEFGKSEL
jgi:hypothetical protein